MSKGKIKTIAMYLPQFHRTVENDEWWGTGFTEWTAVKNAKPLFSGHNQPREPLNDNYYNLLDKKTMQWQSELASKYLIDGFCFYHYWFENGQKILEKPAENLLKWHDIQMPFFFSWANESWVRTWSNVRGGNVWSEIYEIGEKKDKGGILLKQSYGEEKEWKEHFSYLLPFFKDSRYIKIDNKPVFAIHRIDLIPQYSIKKMINYWKKLAVLEGFLGLYIIGVNTPIQMMNFLDANMLMEPRTFYQKMLGKGMDSWECFAGVKAISYDEMWQDTLKRIHQKGKNFLCGAVDYDCTPRRGYNGDLLFDVSATKFYNYFKKLVKKSIAMGNEFVFINAWNEWGEGMYLEPDKKNKFAYLEAVRDAIQGEAQDEDKHEEMIQTLNEGNNELLFDLLEQKDKQISKYMNYFDILHQWLSIKQLKKSIVIFFEKHNYHSIAIYGISILGKHLYEELQGSSIKIEYAIDQRNPVSFVKVLSIQDELPKVDVIIVTATFDYSKIENDLRLKVTYPIVSLEEVINESSVY